MAVAPMESKPESSYKIIFLGNQGTGKSALLSQYLYGHISKQYEPTIGVSYLVKRLLFQGQVLKLLLWDTSGAPRFIGMLPHYIKDSKLAVITFDVTNRASFENLNIWIDLAQQHQPGIKIILVGTKIDNVSQRNVSHEEIQERANYLKLPYHEVSAQSDIDIKNLFETRIPPLLAEHDIANRYAHLHQKIDAFSQGDYFTNPYVQIIANILHEGLKADNPQGYFDQQFQRNDNGSIKYCLMALSQTPISWRTTVANVIVNVLLGLSIIGFPLAYCVGWLKSNERLNGSSFMFFNDGEKQRSEIVCNQVFQETGCRFRV
jgi:Ras-related protein Rab-6A